jgi:hypothetical protein
MMEKQADIYEADRLSRSGEMIVNILFHSDSLSLSRLKQEISKL